MVLHRPSRSPPGATAATGSAPSAVSYNASANTETLNIPRYMVYTPFPWIDTPAGMAEIVRELGEGCRSRVTESNNRVAGKRDPTAAEPPKPVPPRGTPTYALREIACEIAS